MCKKAQTVQGAKGSSSTAVPHVPVHTNLTGWWRAYPQWPQVMPPGTRSHAARRNALQAPEGPAARPPARVRGLRSRRGYGRARGGALRLAPGRACLGLPRQLQLRAAAAEPGPGCVLRGRGRRVASLLCLLSQPSDQTRASRASYQPSEGSGNFPVESPACMLAAAWRRKEWRKRHSPEAWIGKPSCALTNSLLRQPTLGTCLQIASCNAFAHQWPLHHFRHCDSRVRLVLSSGSCTEHMLNGAV